MAKEIILPEPEQQENPKERIEISVDRTDLQRDYSEFVNSLANELHISNRRAFYKRMEGLVNTNNKATIDLDAFKQSLISLINDFTDYKRHNDVIPVDSVSTKNAIVHDDTGKEAILFQEDRRDGTEVTITPYSQNITEEEIDLPREDMRKEEIDIEATMSAQSLIENAKRTKGVNTIELFLYNVIPYAMGDLIGIATSIPAMKGTPVVNRLGSIPSIGNQIYNLAHRKKYYSPTEMAAMLAGVSFILMPFLKGRTIKDLGVGPGVEFSIGNPRNYKVPTRVPGTKGNVWIETLHSLTSEKNLKQVFEDTIWLEGNPYFERVTEQKKWITIDIKATKGYDKEGSSLSDVLNKRTDVDQIGYVYVWPIDTINDDINPFWIPFEFNPKITESSRTARFQSMQVLSRMGDLQAYVGTDSLPVTLSTKYYAVAEKRSDFKRYAEAHLDGYGWMSKFSLQDIQMVELAYRSLVLPYFKPTDASTIESGYKYSRPPLLKVIIGSEKNLRSSGVLSTSANTPFSNLLTYPKELLPNHILKSDLETSQADRRYFRTFIATSVGITKDLEEGPLYLNREAETPYLVDTFGFDVNLSLIEVTPNYMDVLPSFGDYYAGFTKSNKSIIRKG